MISDEPTHLVSSFGGVGTTALLEYLASIPGRAVNPPTGFRNPLKHPVTPPELPSIRRAVFLFGCPSTSLLSLFRRGNDALHYVNVHGLFPEDLDPSPTDAWQQTVERFHLRPGDCEGKWIDDRGRHASDVGALEWFAARKAERDREMQRAQAVVDRLARRAYADWDDYLEQGADHLRREEQFDEWSRARPRSYPILLVRYETFWDHVDAVLDFLEVPAAHRARFPEHRSRQTRLDTLPEHQNTLLRRMNRDLAQKIADAPDTRLLE